MVGMVTKFKVGQPDREQAKKGANFLARAAMLANGGLFFTKQNGERVTTELPSSVLTALQALLSSMAENEEVLLLNPEAELSPEQAAKILGVSRPIVYHRMDSGRLPFREIGTHRRVRLDDVLKLKEFETKRKVFAKALSADTEDLETNYTQPSQSTP